jgi:deoxycytidine triphosphate deaminase
MFISPKVAIENGWVTGITNEDKQVQPNAIDFTIDHLYTISNRNEFVISENEKQMRGGKQISPEPDVTSTEEWWYIEPNTSYDGMSNIHVKLPEGVAAQLIIRSTFNRNGIFLTSGLYDSGYEGAIGFALHNNSGRARIAPGTRIGQLIFVKSDSEGMYAGGYNHKKGTHWRQQDDE